MPERKFETPEIISDAPLSHEKAAHFHFDDFAVTLARLIAARETETPLTIGVSGAWGSGKTTLLRRVQRMLDQTLSLNQADQPDLIEFVNRDESPELILRPCRTVWFNAWKYADEEQLLVALVRVIVQTMARDDLVNKTIAKLLDPSYPRRDVVNTVLSWFSIGVGEAKVGFNTGEAIETPFAEKTAMLDLFDEAFNRLLAAWVHRTLDAAKINPREGVMVVFIDDLDRCLPEKAVQVLEAVKLFLDKTGCIFILGADTRVVRDAVTKYYRDAGVTGENAGDYLEKIIQLRFELPPILAESMGKYLAEVEAADETLQQYWRVLVAGAEVNPRKVKTFLNDLNLAWGMLVNSGQAVGVDRPDFIRWQVLMRAAPDNFRRRVHEIDDRDLAYKFVQDALRWAKGEGDETLENTFRDYAASRRLRRTLRAITTFGDSFDAVTLNGFLHLATVPAEAETPQEERKVDLKATELSAEPVSLETARSKDGPSRRSMTTFGGIEFVRVPQGKFLMGSREDNDLASEGEQPQHTVEIPYDYYLGRFPVTNQQYAGFTQTAGKELKIPGGEEQHPAIEVTWQEAVAYCRWLNENFSAELPDGTLFRLATEAEWEKAARGEYGNEWPWGNEWDSSKCNSIEGNVGKTTPVGRYSPQGDSPYGAADMAGNVWEWTHSLFKGYPYDALDGREDPDVDGARVARGGSFWNDRRFARATFRDNYRPQLRGGGLGLRVVVAPNLA